MSTAEFAEALRHLVREAEVEGLSLPELIALLEAQIEAMQRRLSE